MRARGMWPGLQHIHDDRSGDDEAGHRGDPAERGCHHREEEDESELRVAPAGRVAQDTGKEHIGGEQADPDAPARPEPARADERRECVHREHRQRGEEFSLGRFLSRDRGLADEQDGHGDRPQERGQAVRVDEALEAHAYSTSLVVGYEHGRTLHAATVFAGMRRG